MKNTGLIAIVCFIALFLLSCVTQDFGSTVEPINQEREEYIEADSTSQFTNLYQLMQPRQKTASYKTEYDLTAEFCVYGCNYASFDEENCATKNDAFHNYYWVRDYQDITNDGMACMEFTLINNGPSPVSFSSTPLVMFLYITPEETMGSDAILMGSYNFLGDVPGKEGDKPGECSVHFETENDTRCLPYFTYEKFDYPESAPGSDGYNIFVQLDPSLGTQLPYETNWADNTVKSTCKLKAENGGHDPIWSNADHNDLVWVETRSTQYNSTDTTLFFFVEEFDFDFGDSISTLSFIEEYAWNKAADWPIQNLSDFQTFAQELALYMASPYTPIFSDTVTPAPLPNAKFSKYLPAGDGVLDNENDKRYYIRVQLTPFLGRPLPDCYNLQVCQHAMCDWEPLDSIPCATDPHAVETHLGNAQDIFVDAFAESHLGHKDIVETRLKDNTDFHYYRLIRP